MEEAVWLLAFVHPIWMVAGLAMALATARFGLEIRRRRVRGEPIGRALRERHLRFGRRTLALILVGFGMGPPSMAYLRDRPLLDSFHGVLGIIVLGLFLWVGWSGRSLARGQAQARDVHRIAAASAIGGALLAAVAGFGLLP